MVYIKKWAEFHAQCTELFNRSPERTRYLIKATPAQQWLVLKVTDDVTCLKFRARSAIIINRFESFTRDMAAIMAGLPLPSAAASAVQAMDIDGAAKTPAEGIAKAAAGTEQQGATQSGGGGGGGKKKKKKGKK